MSELEKLFIDNEELYGVKAQQKFYKGMSVIASGEAHAFGALLTLSNGTGDVRGTVTSLCDSPFMVRVKPDGRKSDSMYHMNFWIPAPNQRRLHLCSKCNGSGLIWGRNRDKRGLKRADAGQAGGTPR